MILTSGTYRGGASIALLLASAMVVTAFETDWLRDLRGESTGHTTCGFLSLPVSASVLGRGPVSSPGAGDATDLAFYPANAGLADRNQFAITHLEWLMGLRKEYAAAVFPMLDWGTAGIYSQVFTAGKFQYARDIDEVPSKPTMLEYSLGMSYAVALFKRKLSIGLTGAFVESRLDTESARAGTGGVDLLFAPVDRFLARVYATNYGVINYGRVDEALPLQAGAMARFYPLSPHNPITSTVNFDVAAGAQKTADEPLTVGFSTEWELGQFIRLRGGYEYPLGADASAAGMSLGAGFQHSMYGVDGAWRLQSPDFGSVWAANVTMQLEEITPRSAEDYYAIAQRHFAKRRYRLCIQYARRALKLDPNLWKAHALISMAHSQMLRSRNLEIALIYTGNARGVFLPPPSAESLGGLARQATVIKGLRAQYPVAISIEAGNMLPANAHPLRVSLMDQYFRYIKHDALGVGPGEIGFGLHRFFAQAKMMNTRFVCANVGKQAKMNLVTHDVVRAGPYRFFVVNGVNPAIVADSARRGMLDAGEQVRAALRGSDARSSDLRIVVLHDRWEQVRGSIPKLPGADIVICGGIEQRFEVPMRIDSSIVVSAGADGAFVGCLTIRFTEDKVLRSVENRLVPLLREVKEDTTVAKLVDAIATKINLAEQGIDEQDLVKGRLDGTFLFCSDRYGEPGVFLKVSEKLAEFPLTGRAGSCSRPALSFAAGRVSYLQSDTAGATRLGIMEITGANKRLLAPDKRVFESAFLPDGEWLYFCGSDSSDTTADIFRVRPGGGTWLPVVTFPGSTERSLAFAKDSALMAFCSNRDQTWQVYVCNWSGEQPLRVTDVSANHFAPAFSPDGTRIAYLSDRSNFGGRLDLWVLDRRDGSVRQITSNSNLRDFCWMPDSRTIVYSSGANLFDLNTIDIVANRFAKLIEADSAKTYHEVHPVPMMFNGRQRVMYVREYQHGGREIYWVNDDGTGEQPVVVGEGNSWLEP